MSEYEKMSILRALCYGNITVARELAESFSVGSVEEEEEI